MRASRPLFSRTELPVAALVLLLLGACSGVRGLLTVFGVMTAGLASIGVATLALDVGWINGQSG